MDYQSILLITALFVNLILGAVVFFRNRYQKENRWFIYFVLSVAMWSLTMFFYRISSSIDLSLWWAIILYDVAIFIPPTLLCFSIGFPTGELNISRILKILLWGPVFTILILTSIKNLVITGVQIVPGQEKTILWGTYYLVYNVYFILYFLAIFLVLYKKIKESTGLLKTQLKVILPGIFIPSIIGNTTNLILPTFGIFDFNWLGQATSMIMTGFIVYAITKHQLMNIKVIAVEMLSIIISVFLLIDAFLSTTSTEYVLKFSIFGLVAFFGYMLVRGVVEEVRIKEELAQASKRLKIANTELKKLDEAKSEFLSIASHQLRTPLTAIKGYSSMLIEGDFGELKGQTKETIEKIFEASQRVVNMIEDFLNISRIEMGRMKYDFMEFDLKDAVKKLTEDFIANNKKAEIIKLSFSCDKQSCNVKADKNKVIQVVSNIIDNAIKYTQKGFVKVFLSTDKEKNVCLVKIQDSGVGISKDTMIKIFQKFTRSSDISKLHTDGSGLGLYVAKKIMEDHNGKIWAEPPGENKGSTFYIELPISQK